LIRRLQIFGVALALAGCGGGTIVLDPEGQLRAREGEMDGRDRDRPDAAAPADAAGTAGMGGRAGAGGAGAGGQAAMPDAGAPPVSGVTAREAFDGTVVGPLTASCASCHTSSQPGPGGDFLGAGEADYYAQLKADARMIGTGPSSSLLLNKGAHAGPAFTPAQQAAVSAWITLETAPASAPDGGAAGGAGAGGAGGAAGFASAAQALTAFGDCMALADWDASGMGDLGQQNTTQGRCTACHNTGAGAAFLSDDSAQTFEANRRTPFLLKLVTTSVNGDGSFADILQAFRMRDKGLPGTQHPQYILSDARIASLDQFFRLTYARWTGGPCTP
jgi:hypothetical protein